jgi:PAS domain S-box-containing protein
MLGFFEHDWFSLDLRPPSLDWRSLTPDEWRSHDEHMLVRYFETGKTVSYLKEFYRRPAMGVSHESKDDPSVVPVWISISHLDSHDEFHGVATVYDMTELFEARNLVEENRLKASLALNESNIGIWEFSPYEQRIRWDARCRYMLKLTKISDHPVDDFLEMVHPHDREALKFFDQQLPLQDNPKSRAEFRVSIKSEERIFAITSRIFDFGAGGTPIYIGTLQDVTEAKKSARLLQESEERFRTLAEVIPQIIFISDEIGQILYLNNKWFDYTGVDSKNWNTEIVYSKIHPEDVNRMMTSWNYSLENKKPFEIEYRLQSQAGEYRWFIARAVPLLDGQSKVLRWFGSSTDIHDQKRVSEQLREAKDAAIRADQMKSNFLANMSHEIRTPLGAILGFTDVLAEEHLSESERAEFLGIISRNGHTLSRIVDDILDLSKVEAGMLALENSMFEPRQEIQETVSLFGEKARQKGLALNTVFKNELPDRLNSDPTRFRQILGNLVSNAIKFTERGFVRIEVQIRGNDLEVRVCDSGIGIDSSHIAQLFKPFMQADESMNRRFGGTGLGLHLSRKLAEAMGGSLCIESSVENRGSVFLLKIPVLPNAHAHLNESAVLPVTEPSELKVQMLLQQGDSAVRDLGKNHETRSLLDGFKILIVDDSRDNQLLVERILKRKGAEVEFADNGRMGVEKALSGQFDLILMDVQMPDVDGFEATLDIRSKGLRTPVFALTAHVVDEIRVRCQEVGCDGFLSKPVRASELIEVALRFIHH